MKEHPKKTNPRREAWDPKSDSIRHSIQSIIAGQRSSKDDHVCDTVDSWIKLHTRMKKKTLTYQLEDGDLRCDDSSSHPYYTPCHKTRKRPLCCANVWKQYVSQSLNETAFVQTHNHPTYTSRVSGRAKSLGNGLLWGVLRYGTVCCLR